MSDALIHRGPDSWGEWSDSDSGLSLIHRRLAIVDLTSEGHQPMTSCSGRYIIVFNGEIYNFRELRRELEEAGAAFRGTSDTEVMLAGFEHWGVNETVEKLVGMFAFALWDRSERELWLFRDRAGEKPLYYGWLDGRFCFSSELKSLRFCSRSGLLIDRDALGAYLQFGRVPGPLSIYQGVFKLPPGSFLRLGSDMFQSAPAGFRPVPGDASGQPHRYWNPAVIYESGCSNPLSLDEGALLDEVDSLLNQIVAQQMVADVPVGAFLSGGIDSSLVVSIMQRQRSTPVNTFSIGFSDPEYDEAPYARAVAEHLGATHTELYVTPEDVMQVIPQLPTIADEPLADQSQIPTFLVSRLARQAVTVSLSGDGGDELFGGYERHIYAGKIWDIIRRLPRASRRGAAALMLGCSPAMLKRFFSLAGRRAAGGGILHIAHKLHKTARLLSADSQQDLYVRFSSNWFDPERVLPGYVSGGLPNFSHGWPDVGAIQRKFMLADLTHYLPDTILVKLDKASMAVSLESRAPFLDHRLIELSMKLPSSVLIREGKGKWILREILTRYLPREMVDRPKAGFSMPIGRWLRQELKPWASEFLSERRVREAGLFDSRQIERAWQDHLDGRRDNHIQLWNILAFEAWREKHGGGLPG